MSEINEATFPALELETGLAMLERTPEVLVTWLSGLTGELLDAREGPDTWSPREVVAHLLHAERTNWIPRARVIVEQAGDRRFPPFDRDAHLRDLRGFPIAELCLEFADQRAGSLATLRRWKLGPDILLLTGIHPEFGEVTLGQLFSTWVAHDLGHLAQISRVMAKQYSEAVGPWRAYLSIMDR